MKTTLIMRLKAVIALFALLGLAACGGGGVGSDGGSSAPNWYYHFVCNGDSECLTLNFLPSGTPSGTSNQGPGVGGQSGCNSLMNFGRINWNIPPAQQWCDNSPTLTPPAPTLISITVSPANKQLPLGLTQQYTATGNYSNGTSQNITAQVTWFAPPAPIGEPRPPPIATISASGLATATAAGSTTITATLGSISGTTQLFVTSASLVSITVSPATPTVTQYLTQQFTATGNYSDGSTQNLTSSVTWSSGTMSVATISSTGLATAVAGGTSTITATKGVISGSTTLTVVADFPVSIAVTPANPSIAKGTTGQFTATGTYSDSSVRDITSQATWSSGTPAVATINSSGLSSGLTLGTSVITATFNSISGSTTLTVTAAALQSILVTPVNPSVAQGLTKQFAATGTYSDGTTQNITTQVTWSSATISVATILSSGLSTGVSAGTSIITATKTAISGSTTLTVVIPGANWVQSTSGTTNPLFGVAWSGTQFVAVGASGTILTSPDGVTWTARTSGTTSTLNAVIKAGSQLVAVGASGTILTSPDGITWTTRLSGTSFTLNAATWTGSQIVAVGYGFTTLSSTDDGISWTTLIPSPAQTSPDFIFTCIAWSGTKFVEGGVVGGNAIFVSPDAITYTITFFHNIYGAIWADNKFVLVTLNGIISVSTDAVTWSFPTTGTASSLFAAAWSGINFAVVGAAGTVLTSPDATVWTLRTSGTTQNLRGVAWSGANFVAVGDLGTIFITSP